ncbi:hypothetical protein FIU87_12750 [Bacillus sp. THAF10]|uniref:hypothetical protein n=1 Tax=Bacillus sp. THAF10 TaxID=2587848 RepID=UPI0012678D80|nr:hypothetical protein [Bacillus sp. THAF10]QFT89521.1 hypothetical protein FIU87_12750 [Bacillus sp. THAF10]
MELFWIWGIIIIAFVLFVIIVNASRFDNKTVLEIGVIALGLVVSGGISFYIAGMLQVLNPFTGGFGIILFLTGVFLLFVALFRR